MCAILWVICALGAASTVSSNSLRTADGAVASDVVADGASTFLIMADWGGQDAAPFYTPAEKKVAASMGSMGANASFALAIGDNFYYSGVADVGSARFKATFEVTQPGVSFSGIPNETRFFFRDSERDAFL
ncbi:acid phosphatase [Aureococcus anophagefferens]|nr:acid phosphatase [Aureococcus anophagefferens]